MTLPTFENIRFEITDRIALITFARPKAMNALNESTLRELHAAIDRIETTGDAGALILTGDGKAFVAGADIAAMQKMSAEDGRTFAQYGNDLFARIERLPIPVIAAVNGFALGGGCELALCCDFIYASAAARFGQPEVNLGLIAGFGGTQRLIRKVPHGMAMELLLTGNMIDATEALRIGLVNRVVAADADPGLLAQARATAATILTKGAAAVRISKRAAQASAFDMTLADGLRAEIAGFAEAFALDDRMEGVTAFLEKRTAQFRSR